MSRLIQTLIRGCYKLPTPLKKIIGPISVHIATPRLFGGKDYITQKKFFLKSQWWLKGKLEDYQLEKLKLLLNHAYNNVPYYREIFKKHNLKPDSIKSFEDLDNLPILTREDVIKNFRKLIAKNTSQAALKLYRTSGSTGMPLTFCLDRQNNLVAASLYTRCLAMMGHKPADKAASLEFTFFLERNDFASRCFHDWILQKMYLSSKASMQKDFAAYLDALTYFNPDFVQGNPSMLYLLASCAEETNRGDVHFKSFLSLFENLYAFQRDKIRRTFDCSVFNYYCSREHIISAMECEKHKGLHIDMENGIVEVADKHAYRLKAGKTGRILATGLNNFVMPFIRYEIGDYAQISKKMCSCGRESPLLESINGRSVGILKYGSKFVYPTTLSLLTWQFPNIKECQFIQENETELVIKIVKRRGYSRDDTKKLVTIIKKILNDQSIKVNVQFTDFIPRTQGGKFEFVIRKTAA